MDKESKAYVDPAVPAIVSSWSERELLNRASSEFRQITSPEDVQRFFQTLRPLGRLREYKGSQGQAITYHDLAKGTTVSANYTVIAEFEAGYAKIYVKLIDTETYGKLEAFVSNLLTIVASPANLCGPAAASSSVPPCGQIEFCLEIAFRKS